MAKEIRKRNGKKEPLDISKIIYVLQEADRRSDEKVDNDTIKEIANLVLEKEIETTDDIRKNIEQELISRNLVELARSYIIGCYDENRRREREELDKSILGVIHQTNRDVLTENGNKSPKLVSTQRDLIAGEVNKDLSKKFIYMPDVMEAHEKKALHIHDSDYAAQYLHNCDLLNIEDMLQNGTVINNVKIDVPKSLRTAMTLVSQISAQVSSMQFGGQSISLAHVAPFVDVSRKKIRKQVREELKEMKPDKEVVEKIVEERLRREIRDSVQTINYQWSTISSTNGQSPFVTLFMYLGEVSDKRTKADLALLIEEVLKQRVEGFKNRQGYHITPTFPKLIYVLEEDNIHEESPYWYLTKLAAHCIGKRMMPDLISEKVMKSLKVDSKGNGYCYPAMGCRSFLPIWEDSNTGKVKLYGRFNLGVVSLNLVYYAYESKGDLDRFWQILDKYAHLAFKAHMSRVGWLKNATADVAPILWQDGALARMEAGEPIEKLFYDGYSSISLGYMGLFETVRYLTGLSHTDERAISFAKEILNKLNEYCEEWSRKTRLGFSVYGTPGESLTGKFAKAIRDNFDPGFRTWVTNSFHVDVEEKITAFDKLRLESMYQELSPGGSISYIETSNLQKNEEAILSLMKYIYETIMYAEVNSKSDVCSVCGYEGEIELVEDENGEYFWRCPNCTNTDTTKMTIIRRLCGYLGNASNGINQGRLADIQHRELHLS